MTNAATLTDLFRHMEWADAAVWTAVLASPQARTDAELHPYVSHLDAVQRGFLRVWRGEPREAPDPTGGVVEALMPWVRPYDADAREHLAPRSDADLAQPLPVPWSATVEERIGRAPETTTTGETALQVVLHSMYHRGQMN